MTKNVELPISKRELLNEFFLKFPEIMNEKYNPAIANLYVVKFSAVIFAAGIVFSASIPLLASPSLLQSANYAVPLLFVLTYICTSAIYFYLHSKYKFMPNLDVKTIPLYSCSVHKFNTVSDVNAITHFVNEKEKVPQIHSLNIYINKKKPINMSARIFDTYFEKEVAKKKRWFVRFSLMSYPTLALIAIVISELLNVTPFNTGLLDFSIILFLLPILIFVRYILMPKLLFNPNKIINFITFDTPISNQGDYEVHAVLYPVSVKAMGGTIDVPKGYLGGTSFTYVDTVIAETVKYDFFGKILGILIADENFPWKK